MARIGIDVRLTRYRQGGIAAYMRHLTDALAAQDSRHDFLMLHHPKGRDSLTPGPRFRRVNCYTPCHHRWEGTALGLELLPRRLDLLHSPDFIPPRFGAKHYLITVHDLAFLLLHGIQTADSLHYYAGQIKRAVSQAAAIIAVSETTKADLMRLLDVPAEKIRVIYEGVDPMFRVLPEAVVREKLRSYLLPPDFILFVGTIEPRKNIPMLLRGYHRLKVQQPESPKLIIAGQRGWLYEESIRTCQELGLQEDVIWIGGVPFEVLPALYNAARVHVLASLYEGFGFPPLEAMACGTPTIVSERGALREITDGAAFYVDPDDEASIADGLLALLNNPSLYDSLRAKGLEHVQRFTWAQAARQTLALYDQVLA